VSRIFENSTGGIAAHRELTLCLRSSSRFSFSRR